MLEENILCSSVNLITNSKDLKVKNDDLNISDQDIFNIFIKQFKYRPFYEIIINLLLVKNSLRKSTLIEYANIYYFFRKRTISNRYYNNIISFIDKYFDKYVDCLIENKKYKRYLVVNKNYNKEFLNLKQNLELNNTKNHDILLGQILGFINPGKMNGKYYIKIDAQYNNKNYTIMSEICDILPEEEYLLELTTNFGNIKINNLIFKYATGNAITLANIKDICQNLSEEIYNSSIELTELIDVLQYLKCDIKNLKQCKDYNTFKICLQSIDIP